MRFLYAIPILLLPNTAHLPADFSVGASLILLFVAMLLGERDRAELARPGVLWPPLLALFLAMLVGFVSAHWHDLSDAERDLREAKVAVLFPVLYLAYRRCGLDLARTRQLIVVVLIVAVLAGLEAVSQAMRFNLGAFSETQRATGPFGQIHMANRAGVFFAMFLPMLVALVLRPKQRRSVRLLALAGSVILMLGILFTYSRQAYLIALFAIMVLLVWRSVPVAAIAAVVLVASAVFFLPGSVVDRVQQTQQSDVDGSVVLDPSTSSRFVIWRGAIEMLRDNPMGVGLGRFSQRIADYTAYGRKDAHNGFVLTLAELGPLGLMALLWVFWRLWRLARMLRQLPGALRPEAKTFERGFTLAVVAMALGNLYGSPFFDSVIMANFWILCGLMERYGLLKAHEADLAIAANHKPWAATPIVQQFPLVARALPGMARPRNALH